LLTTKHGILLDDQGIALRLDEEQQKREIHNKNEEDEENNEEDENEKENRKAKEKELERRRLLDEVCTQMRQKKEEIVLDENLKISRLCDSSSYCLSFTNGSKYENKTKSRFKTK